MIEIIPESAPSKTRIYKFPNLGYSIIVVFTQYVNTCILKGISNPSVQRLIRFLTIALAYDLILYFLVHKRKAFPRPETIPIWRVSQIW